MLKINFIEGVAGHRGSMVANINNCGYLICGQCWSHGYGDEIKRGITIVRQRSKWFTLLIFIHEMAHHIIRKRFRGELRIRMNDWVDRYLKRRRDKLGRRWPW
jgi:cellulose synthase/poly-beta-1,6-N-acetylglucosamine synthase-like glycosyltransferase